MVKRAIKSVARNTLPILIALLIITIIVFGLNSIVNNISKESANQKKDIPYICDKQLHPPAQKNIVFRIDDIQAYYLRDLQINMIDNALRYGVSPSLAVIPVGISDDDKLFDYLKMNHCNVEIMLHGYDNKDFEFEFLTYESANSKIEKGLKELNKIEPNVITFVPPGNEYSKGTEQAVYSNGIRAISADPQNSEYGFTISTFDWANYKFRNYKDVIKACNESLMTSNRCVIMIHPQDYITNGKLDIEKYNQYINLLSEITKLNANIVNFRDLVILR